MLFCFVDERWSLGSMQTETLCAIAFDIKKIAATISRGRLPLFSPKYLVYRERQMNVLSLKDMLN